VDNSRTLKSSATRRIVIGILGASFFAAHPLAADEDRWTVNFQSGGQAVGSTVVALHGDKGSVLVSVAHQGGDLSKSAVQLGNRTVSANFAGYDSVSRLCFFRPVEGVPVQAPKWQGKATVPQGGILTARSGKIEVLGKMEGWVYRIGGKVLPLALMKVNVGGTIPSPGTPLIDPSGTVAAVVFQKAEGERRVYAIPAEAVHRVAKDVALKGRLVRGWLGLSLRVENESPKIVRVFPGSPAGVVGIKEDDVISKIGGRDVSDYAEVVNAFFYVVPGESVDIEVRRGQNILAFTVVPAVEKPGN
jgi:hypothetical protein